MKRWSIAALLLCAGLSVGAQAETAKEKYETAMELIHEFNGSGDQLNRASGIIESLMKSDSTSGYAETLLAEMISTWQVDQNGEPPANRQAALHFAGRALQLNPNLAQAYVARARIEARLRDFVAAGSDINAALKIDPNLSGAVFMQADLYRRMSRYEEAETWYLKFISIAPSPARKSNGYAWMGDMYKAAAWDRPREWAAMVAKAKAAYEKGLELDPGPWKTVNYAIFLNNEVGDFEAAERYAQKALSIMDFPMARYQLAIARYQKLRPSLASMDSSKLKAAVGDVQRSTGISLQQALDFCTGCTGMHGRLEEVNARMTAGK